MAVDYPKQLSVMVTSRCNLRCKLCYQTEYHSDLDPRLLETMRHVYPKLEWFHPIGGEPFLYDLEKLYSLPFGDGCKLKIITNGTMILAGVAENIIRNVDRLIVSIDGGTEDAYREMRGYSLDKVLAGIERIQSCRVETGSLTPEVEINFLLARTTVDTLPNLASRAESLGVHCINVFYPGFSDSTLRDSEGIGRDDAKEVIESARQYIDIIEPEKRGGELCQRPWNNCFVDVNGNVFLCCFGSPVLGNLNENSFDECWFGPIATRIRETVNSDREMTCCRECPVR